MCCNFRMNLLTISYYYDKYELLNVKIIFEAVISHYMTVILGHLNTVQWMTESSISKYARLLTWAKPLGLLFEWAELQEKLELAPGPQNLATTLFHFFSLYPLLPLHTPLPPHSPQSGQVRAVVDSPLTLQGGRLEHVHPPASFILCQSAGRIEGSVLIFIRLPLPFFLSSTWRGVVWVWEWKAVGWVGWAGGQNQEPRGMKRWGEWVGMVRIEGGEKRRMHVVLFKWMGND